MKEESHLSNQKQMSISMFIMYKLILNSKLMLCLMEMIVFVGGRTHTDKVSSLTAQFTWTVIKGDEGRNGAKESQKKKKNKGMQVKWLRERKKNKRLIR